MGKQAAAAATARKYENYNSTRQKKRGAIATAIHSAAGDLCTRVRDLCQHVCACVRVYFVGVCV